MDFSANKLSKAGVLGTLLLSFFFWTASVQALDLIEAVREQDSAAVRSLIAEGSDPNIAQADGATALHWAVHRENAHRRKRYISDGISGCNAVSGSR